MTRGQAAYEAYQFSLATVGINTDNFGGLSVDEQAAWEAAGQRVAADERLKFKEEQREEARRLIARAYKEFGADQ